jgi:hypothetical protein
MQPIRACAPERETEPFDERLRAAHRAADGGAGKAPSIVAARGVVVVRV